MHPLDMMDNKITKSLIIKARKRTQIELSNMVKGLERALNKIENNWRTGKLDKKETEKALSNWIHIAQAVKDRDLMSPEWFSLVNAGLTDYYSEIERLQGRWKKLYNEVWYFKH